jgi:hypothetical protein
MAFATSSGTTYDYTVTQTAAGAKRNPDAKNEYTVREGGGVIRNFINWDRGDLPSSATATDAVSNIFKILYVPPGSIVRQLRIGTKIGETAVAHSYGSASSASDGKSAVLNIGWEQNKSASGSSQVVDIDAFADHAITKKTGALAAGAFGTISASTPWTFAASQSDSGAPTLPMACPYGGYITMQLTGGSSTASVDGAMAGDMVVEAVVDRFGGLTE